METREPRIAKKYRLPIIAILLISAMVIGVFAAILFTQNYTYQVGTEQVASVSGPTTLDFGTLSGDASSSKLFPSALTIGAGSTTSITFAYVNPTTTWNTVFSGIAIVAQTQAAVPVGVACISLGTGTCPSALTAAFIPAASTHYDYLASFTAASVPTPSMTLQTMWSDTPVAAACPLPVALGSASTYGVLAGSTITGTGSITGDLGLSPGTSAAATVTQTGARNVANAAAATAIADLTAALTSAQGRTPAITIATALGGQTLTCGVYNTAAGTLDITGTLTLNGDANAVWVFQAASTLITAAGANIVLTGGATANHVFFAVGSSATLGAGNTFKGTIMALASITIGAGTTMNGGVLAETAAVTLDTDTITVP